MNIIPSTSNERNMIGPFNLMMDTVAYGKKPDKETIAVISTRLGRSQASETNESYIEKVLRGIAFSPSTFKDGVRSNKTWVSQEIFALDFDDNITIEEFMAMVEKYKIVPFFVYKSYTHTEEHHKFRAVFRMNVCVTDKRVRGLVYHALHCLFDKKSDPSCKDAARFLFGTDKGSEFIDLDARVDIFNLVQTLTHKYGIENEANFNRCMKDFCQFTSLNMNGNFAAVSLQDSIEEEGAKADENSPTSIIYTIELAVFPSTFLRFSFSTTEDNYATTRQSKSGAPKDLRDTTITKSKSTWVTRRDIDLDELPEVCELAYTLESGTAYLNHAQRHMLMSSYIQIEGGETRFMKALDSREEYAQEFRKERAKMEIRYAKEVGYLPTSCSPDVCPFFNECLGRRTNPLLKLAQKRGEVRRIEAEVEGKSIEQAEEELKAILTEAYHTPTARVTVIKAPTGIGKTKAMIDLPLKNTIIAVPTHKLREEIYADLSQAGHRFLTIPARPPLVDKKDEEMYQLYIRVGASKRASKLLYKVAEKYTAEKNKTSEMVAVIAYVDTLKRIPNANNLLITHKRLMQIDGLQADTIIIDEDMLFSEILPLTQIKESDLSTLLGQAALTDKETHALLLAYVQMITNTPINQVEEIRTVIGSTRKLEDLIVKCADALSSNVAEMFKPGFFVRREGQIFCVSHVSLLSKFLGVNIIIMSASANEPLYRQAFGNVSFIDLGKVKMTGSIVGHYKKGYSRYSLSSSEEKFQKEMAEIKEEIGDMNVITYKAFKKPMEDEGLNVVATFGATAGLNEFKGEDLAVIGTPHVNNIKYIMTAKALGIPVGGFDQEEVEYVPVKRNGYEFYFNTFSHHALLREIQFAIIESELIQAVGRARALRFDCTVHLYTNLPIY
jgi:hypothetical protein